MYIKKASSYIPSTVLKNSDYESSLDTTDEWITKRTGIKTRHTAVVENPVRPVRHMAIRAVDNLNLTDSEKKKIKTVVFAAGLAEENYPSVGNYVAEYLGLPIPGIRVNSACSSFVSGLKFSSSLIDSGDVLLVTSESFTAISDYSDRSSAILTGDGACSFILSREPTEYFIYDIGLSGFGSDLINTGLLGKTPKKNILDFCLENKDLNEKQREALESTTFASYGCFYQNGPEVYKTIIKDIPKLLKQKIKKNILKKEKIYFIGHQANLRMLEAVYKKIGLTEPSRHLYNVDRYGNTGAAGCGICLAEEINNNKFVSGDSILLSAFGAGIVYGSAIIKRI